VARILEEWEDAVGAVEVIPGANGIFDVHLNGELVFTKSMLGRYPQPDEVVPLLREHIAAA
jgi:selT/selW/selH-like putative selenoprotein